MVSKELNILLKKINDLQGRLNNFKPIDDDLSIVLQEKLRIEWTYNSNAIEGSTLTFGETFFFLREGLTSEGKPLKDFLEAKNHSEAIETLDEILKEERPITEFLIKSLHSILLKGVDFTMAKGKEGFVKKQLHIGEYKKQPNHVMTVSGEIHNYVDPIHVKEEMEKLIAWYNSDGANEISSIERACILHYKFVSIHPFDDGNGRLARILMNLVLMKEGLPPCIIKIKNRRNYLRALEKIDKTQNYNSFYIFVAQELLETMVFIVDTLEKGKSSLANPFTSLNKNDRQNLILKIIEGNEVSIGQISSELPHLKRPTLKKDLQELLESQKIFRKGVGKGVLYFINK